MWPTLLYIWLCSAQTTFFYVLGQWQDDIYVANCLCFYTVRRCSIKLRLHYFWIFSTDASTSLHMMPMPLRLRLPVALFSMTSSLLCDSASLPHFMHLQSFYDYVILHEPYVTLHLATSVHVYAYHLHPEHSLPSSTSCDSACHLFPLYSLTFSIPCPCLRSLVAVLSTSTASQHKP